MSKFHCGTTVRWVNSDAPERVLIVGGGSIGRRHAANVQTIFPGVDCRLLTHHSPILTWPDGIEIVSSVEEVRAFAPDLVVVANPASSRLDTVAILSEVCHHFFIEKPLAPNHEAGLSLVELIVDRDLRVGVGYNLRYNASLKFLRSVVESRELGRAVKVNICVGQSLTTWRAGVDYRSTVTAQRRLAGGALRELSHEFDYLTWMFGRLMFMGGMIQNSGLLDVDVEDSAAIHLSAGDCPQISIDMDLLRRQPVRNCHIICEGGDVRWDCILGSVVIVTPDGTETTRQFEPGIETTYVDELVEYWSSRREKRGVSPELADALDVLRLVDEIEAGSYRHGL